MPKRVLVIDAIATHRIRLAALLESAHYSVTTVAGAHEFQGRLGDVDLILFGLPEERPGAVIASLATALQGSMTPILCLDARNSALRRLLVLRAGARDVLPSKSPDELLLSRLRGLIRERDAQRECERRRVTAASFGFSDAAPTFARRARIVCTGPGACLAERLSAFVPHDVVSLGHEDILRNDAPQEVPDAFVVWVGEDIAGSRNLLAELCERTSLRQAPVLVVYPPERPEIAAEALMRGAREIAVETAGLEEIELRITNMLARKKVRDALRQADEQSYRLAVTDPMTGLYNRRYAEAYLADILARPDAEGKEFCLLLVDVDHFKQVNDLHGHAVGDQVLTEVAQRLQDDLRACDLVARYGGEEFLIVLPESAVSDAMSLAKRLLRSIASSPVRVGTSDGVAVTVSIGVATGRVDNSAFSHRTGTFDRVEHFGGRALQPVFEAADAALYRAKSAGRNRVEFNAV